MPLPRFTEVARRRPAALVQPGTSMAGAPYAAVTGPAPELRAGRMSLRARHTGRRVVLDVVRDGEPSSPTSSPTSRHASRRHGWTGAVDELAVTLTGPMVTAWSRTGTAWTARAATRLGSRRWWEPLVPGDGVSDAGGFGQLGLRDLRAVSHVDGSPYVEGGRFLLTATSAGPGGFRTGHTSVWALDPGTLDLAHRADLFFTHTRLGPVLGHHATHLVRDGGSWLVTTSTWGSFDRQRRPGVAVRVARSLADLTRGRHVLRSESLPLPTDGLGSVGVWDSHLVHDGERWLVAYVSARRFFSFHPALAAGRSLADLALVASAPDRVACEGPTLAGLPDGWRVLGSDGRDEPAGRRAGYPCFDLSLREVGRLDASYPSNLPWPTVLPLDGGWLMVGCDGTPYGGGLVGYGSHGDVVIQATSTVAQPPSSWLKTRSASGPVATSSASGAPGGATSRPTSLRSMS